MEICSDFREILKLKGYTPAAWDFMEYNPSKKYDAIVMNPPFSGNRDIDHVKHAYSMLAPGGTLVAVTSPHWSFARESKCANFRNWLDTLDYDTDDLNGGTFEMTGVHSKILVIRNEAQEQYFTA